MFDKRHAVGMLPVGNRRGPIAPEEIVAVIRPFSALRPPAERAGQVASVPYDVVNTEEARALAASNPLSFLHVSRPEIDLPDGTDVHSDPVYRQAAENFDKLIKDCPLVSEEAPSIYLYRLIMGDHEQMGITAPPAPHVPAQNSRSRVSDIPATKNTTSSWQ